MPMTFSQLPEDERVKILVLGGCGIQGRAAIFDLVRSRGVDHVICADARPECLGAVGDIAQMKKVEAARLDAAKPDELIRLFQQADAVIDLLPRHFMETVCRASIESGVGLVNTNYAYPLAHLDLAAKAAGVSILPECGLDPGIDLLVYGEAVRRFEELHTINSYCGGIPEASACDNALNYKLSWTWEGVLSSTMRESRMIKDGRRVDISALDQHNAEFVHQIDFPGLGMLEAVPNGDAVFFTDLLGVTATIRETGRYSLRWPGWSSFWRPLKRFGFLSQDPVAGLCEDVSPYQMVDKLMGPQLQYQADEKDLVVMVNVFEGISGGRNTRLSVRLFIERDLETGLMAMSKGVGFPASIAAQMIARGEISQAGILSPALHVPYEPFMAQLAARGVAMAETLETLD